MDVDVCRYRFTLPYEVAGFCTLLLPPGCPAGASAQRKEHQMSEAAFVFESGWPVGEAF